MSRPRDPHARLCHALAASGRVFGLTPRLLAIEERPWASATFVGHRLTLTLAIDGGDRTGWLAALPEADLMVPGRIVADLVVVDRADGATLEVLLLEA